jgi:hypothetical protein
MNVFVVLKKLWLLKGLFPTVSRSTFVLRIQLKGATSAVSFIETTFFNRKFAQGGLLLSQSFPWGNNFSWFLHQHPQKEEVIYHGGGPESTNSTKKYSRS